MGNGVSEDEVHKAISEVKHPAINRSLKDLGIVKDITVENNRVTITIAFPFANIPIADFLIRSLRMPIEKLGADVDIVTTIMNQEELQAFLKMEQEGWVG